MSYNELSKFLEQLNAADIEDDSVFHALLKQSEVVLSLGDADLARELRISRPTVNRWRSGKNAPHIFMRHGILDWLKKRTRSLQKKAKVFEGSGSGTQGAPPSSKVASARY